MKLTQYMSESYLIRPLTDTSFVNPFPPSLSLMESKDKILIVKGIAFHFRSVDWISLALSMYQLT